MLGKRQIDSDWARTLSCRVVDSDSNGGSTLATTSGVMTVHPGVLGKRSKFFLALADTEPGLAQVEFVVPGGMPIFLQFVEFLYSGTLTTPITVENCVQLFYLSYKYEVTLLQDQCRQWWNNACFLQHPASTSTSGDKKKQPRFSPYIIRFLSEIYRRPMLEQLFAHLAATDRSKHLDQKATDDSILGRGVSILGRSWDELARQLWADAHGGRSPVVVYGSCWWKMDKTGNRFVDHVRDLFRSVPTREAPQFLERLSDVERAALAAFRLSRGVALSNSVYDMDKLSPMSGPARTFLSRCSIGHSLAKPLYLLDRLPSLHQTAAAIIVDLFAPTPDPKLDTKKDDTKTDSKNELKHDIKPSLAFRLLWSATLPQAGVCESDNTGNDALEAVDAWARILGGTLNKEDTLAEFETLLKDHGEEIWSRPQFIGPLLDHLPQTNAELYERVCVALLESLYSTFQTKRLPTLKICLDKIQFARFFSHDRSWTILQRFIRQLTDMDLVDNAAAVAVVKQLYAKLPEHRYLSLDVLKRAAPNEIPNEIMLQILSSEDRERTLLQRQRLKDRELELTDGWFAGQVLDVSDLEHWGGKWCPAEILTVRTESDGSCAILIKYIGWSTFYNRWINARTEAARIATLGKHTQERALYGPERGSTRNTPPPPPPPPPVAIPPAIAIAAIAPAIVPPPGLAPVAVAIAPIVLPVPMPVPVPPALAHERKDQSDSDSD
jgi:hypothetical protein